MTVRPATGGARGTPFAPACTLPAAYVLDEHIVEGTATAYSLRQGATYEPSGLWDAVPSRKAPFRTRALVVRPAEPARFGGTILVNWQNVTRGFETGAPPQDLAALGLAWVGVSAQRVGHEGFPQRPGDGLKGWDPARYGTLEHPGDDFSFDIFSQVARACTAIIDPDGLHPLRLIATGASQSALRLRAYVNAVHPLERLFDGYLLTLDVGAGALLDTRNASPSSQLRIPSASVRIRPDLGVPVMVVNSESEVPRSHPVRQPDGEYLRLWEVAGSAHISHEPDEQLALARALEAVGIDPFAGVGSPPPDANRLSHAPVVRAATRHAVRWVESGTPPPGAAPIEVTEEASPRICRDHWGLARGGVRLPDVEAPLAEHSGVREDAEDILTRISGWSRPFSPTVRQALYPKPDNYLTGYRTALDAAISAGHVVEDDRAALLHRAEAQAAGL